MREQRERLFAAPVVVALGTLLLAPAARGDLINITADIEAGIGSVGAFTGTIEYNFDALKARGNLEISLVNTTPGPNSGFLTGFVFNINSGDPGASASLTFTSFDAFEDTGTEPAPPFGDYDAGAAVGGDWTGGGDPHLGIAGGQIGVFRFNVQASDASSLSAMSFITGPLEHNFVVRFKGFNGGGSNKLPATVIPNTGSISLLAIAGLLVTTRRRGLLGRASPAPASVL